MKKLIIILSIFPFTLFSQVDHPLTRTQVREINQSIIDGLEDYEKHIRANNEQNFYDLFWEQEPRAIIINDIIPSKTFGEKINESDWIDLMKTNKIYKVNTEIKKFYKYKTFSSDSGTVNVIVDKKVKTAIWSDISYNISLKESGKEITEKVIYSSQDEYDFMFFYKLNKSNNSYEVRIMSITTDKGLKKRKIYIPYKTSFIPMPLLAKRFDDPNPFEVKNNNVITGGTESNKVMFFMEDDMDINVSKLDDYKIAGFKKPKVGEFITPYNRLNFRILIPLEVSYSLASNINIDFGNSLMPSEDIVYKENNISVLIPMYKLKKNFSLNLKLTNLTSTSTIILDEHQSITKLIDPNPLNISGDTYIRTNTVTNFIENIDISQQLLFGGVSWKFKGGVTLTGNLLLYNINDITSVRSADVKYTATFPQYHNVEIDETIYYLNGESLELGYQTWTNFEEKMVFDQDQKYKNWEIGVSYKLPIPKLEVHLLASYVKNDANWFVNKDLEISPDLNTFNSFVDVSEKMQIEERFNFGLSFVIKL